MDTKIVADVAKIHPTAQELHLKHFQNRQRVQTELDRKERSKNMAYAFCGDLYQRMIDIAPNHFCKSFEWWHMEVNSVSPMSHENIMSVENEIMEQGKVDGIYITLARRQKHPPTLMVNARIA